MDESVEPGEGSQAGYTLLTGQPVIVGDMELERRFKVPGVIRAHDIVSGMSVVIGGDDAPYGVLGALTTRRRVFTHDDIHFLQSVAHVLASTIKRTRVEEELIRSRNQLSVILQSVADGITVQDPSGRLVYANEAAARLIGFGTVDSLIGASSKELISAFELCDASGNPIPVEELPGRKAVREGERSEAVIRFRSTKGGDECWSTVRASPVKDDHGNVVLVVNVFQDITQAEASRGRLQFIAQATEILSSSLDHETTLANVARLAVPALADWCLIEVLEEDGSLRRIALTNPDPAREKMVSELEKRYPPRRTSSPDFPDPLETGKPLLVPDVTEEMLAAGAVDDRHLKILRGFGLRSVMVIPLIARGRVLGLVTLISAESGKRFDESDLALAEDVARRAAVAVDNARLYSEAQEALRIREEFLSIASHELKTPLTALQLQIQVLERLVSPEARNELSEERARGLAVGAERQLRRLGRLVNDLLDVSRISAGKFDLEYQEVNLGELCEEVAQRFVDEAAAAGSRIDVEPPQEPVTPRADQFRLDQVLTNLVSNALKYGEGRPVRLAIERTGDGGRILVQDHGIGIEAEQLSRIFERFERVAQSHSYGGLGLGLYIARQIVEAHGGQLEVTSEPGKGSTFTVTLPSGPPSAVDDAIPPTTSL
jgi:PAS domain S-box-containing protein